MKNFIEIAYSGCIAVGVFCELPCLRQLETAIFELCMVAILAIDFLLYYVTGLTQ